MSELFSGRSEGLPFDVEAALSAVRAADPSLTKLIDRVGGFALRIEETPSTFEALANAIIYQQLTAKAAGTILGRTKALFGTVGFPCAADIAGVEEVRLRGAGLSRPKIAALKDLARRVLAGSVPTLEEMRSMDDEAIITRLVEVRGVGRWTAEMLLIFRLGRPDVLPLTDLGIKKGFARTFPRVRKRGAAPEELPDGELIARRGERWRPYRTVASWYLWRAAEGR